MAATDPTATIDEEASGVEGARAPAEALALAVAWCADAPWRAGEIAFLPPGRLGDARLFGRGEALPGDPHPRLAFARQRPQGIEVAPAFELGKISRAQLVLSASGLDHILVRNVGRCPLLVGGVRVEQATIAPGRTLQLGQQLLLLCVRRPVSLPAPPADYPAGAFGAADGLGIVGESACIWRLRQQLGLVGPRSGHVLLLGASGSGKELAARALHALSERHRRPLVARNAATIPESLVDAELFGNTRNYPNPGMAERSGLIGEAHGSTLFLDEIAEIPPAMQAHLLRVLDGGEYHRLGESVARRSEMRLIAATSRHAADLKHDLLARFAYRIEIPDLNARREDVPLLIAHLLHRLGESDPALRAALGSAPGDEACAVSLGLCAQLVERSYAGNLRELERLLLQAFVESGGAPLGSVPGVTEDADVAVSPGETVPPPPLVPVSDDLRPERIQAVLDQHNGRIEAASRTLGLKNRFVLGRLIAKYGLEVRRRRS